MEKSDPKKMNRRGFLVQSAKAAAAASAFGVAYLVLDQRPDFPIEDTAKKANADYRINESTLKNKLAVAEGDDPRELGRRVIKSLGGIEKFISSGDKVVIKPNIAWDSTSELGADTNPDLIGELVRLTLEAGAAKVIVTDVPCHEAERTFARSGIQEAAQKAGAMVIIPKEEDFVEVDMRGKILTTWPVLKYFLEATKFINVPVVKNHSLTRLTGGLKNLYGIIGGPRNQLHQKIDQSIVDLASFLKPTLIVGDAYRVLMRHGPTGGSPDDVKLAKTVFATTDQVAADAFACQFLELDPLRVSHLVLADKEGLGSMNLGQFEIIRS